MSRRSPRASRSATGAATGAALWVRGLVIALLVGLAGVDRTVASLVSVDPLRGTVLADSYFHRWVLWAVHPDVATSAVGASALGVFTVVPAGLTLPGGYLLERRFEWPAAPLAGVVLAAGYLPVAAATVGLATLSGGPLVVSGAGTPLALGVTGVVFPVAFGSAGAAAVRTTRFDGL